MPIYHSKQAMTDSSTLQGDNELPRQAAVVGKQGAGLITEDKSAISWPHIGTVTTISIIIMSSNRG